MAPSPGLRAALAAVVVLLGATAHARAPVASAGIGAVAVFPAENLTGKAVSGAELRQSLIQRFQAAGVRVLEDDALDEFLARHRVRYTAGIDTLTAQQLRQEAGVEAVAVATVEFSSEAVPPKVALFARLISITDAPVVMWADDVALSGDDAPGLFELGLVNDYQTILNRSLDRLGDSLASYLETGKARTHLERASKFRPKAHHGKIDVAAGGSVSVAVVPFYNLSARHEAGDIVALHFIRHLTSFATFRVIDTGAVRQQLLDARIIMDGGLSIVDATTVASLVQADFVLAGRILRYEDYEGPAGRAGVEFSAVLIDTRTRKVVWSADSYNDGSDGISFFQRGMSRTAHTMATQMVRLATELIVSRGD